MKQESEGNINSAATGSLSEKEMSNIPQMKKALRKEILAARNRIPAQDKAQFDRQIWNTVAGAPQYMEAEAVLAYASYRSEVGTSRLIEQALADGKCVFVPKVAGDKMEFWRIPSVHSLHAGYRGIPEPDETVSFPEWITAAWEDRGTKGREILRAIMWMPGAVFSTDRYRIGYGGGFYDKYLESLENLKRKYNAQHICFSLTTAALAYSCQVTACIPYAPHDVRPDMVITEKGIL